MRKLWMLIWGFGAGSLSAQTGDFSRGFARLYDLGLPDVAGAQYVKLDAYGPGFDFDSVAQELKLTGNAWMLADASDEKPARMVTRQARTMEIYSPEQLARLQQQEIKKEREMAGASNRVVRFHGSFDFSRPSGQWRAADLKRDLKTVSDRLEKPPKEGWDPLESGLGSGGAGVLFLFAAHGYRQGFTNEANQLVATLFKRAGDSRRVIAQGLNCLADGQYETAYDAFRRDRDWAGFKRQLTEPIARFPSGWQQRGAVERLAGLVEERAKADQPPEIAGEGLGDEDRRLARELIRKSEGQGVTYRQFSGVWLLPETEDSNEPMEEESASLQDVKKRRMESVPLLLALLDDTYLTDWQMDELRGSVHFSSSRMEDAPGEEMTARLFRDMSRPATRGDIARALLLPLLISEDEYGRRNRELDNEALRVECEAWYNQNKTNAPQVLARLYLEQGNSAQKESALQYLIANSTKEELPALQMYLVDDENPDRSLRLIVQYATIQGAAARDFVERYIEQYREAQEKNLDRANFDNDEYRVHMQVAMSNQVRQLRMLVSGQSAPEALAAVAAGEQTLEQVRPLLTQRLKVEKPDAAIAMILRAAQSAPTPARRLELLRLLMQTPAASKKFLAQYRGRDPGVELDLSKTAELWKPLLEDERVESGVRFGAESSVAVAAAGMMELLYGADVQSAWPGPTTTLGRRGAEWIRQRARQRLEGKREGELTPIPDANHIGADQRRELVARLMAAQDSALAAALAELSLSEWLAIQSEASKNEEFNRHLRSLAAKIVEVKAPEDSPDAGAVKAWEGRSFNRALVEEVLAFCRNQVATGRPVSVELYRQPCLEGVLLRVAREIPVGEQNRFLTRLMPTGGVACVVGCGMLPGGAWITAVWDDIGDKSDTPASRPGGAEDDLIAEALGEISSQMKARIDDNRASFWEKMDELDSDSVNATLNARVFFIGRPAAAAATTNIVVPSTVDPAIP